MTVYPLSRPLLTLADRHVPEALSSRRRRPGALTALCCAEAELYGMYFFSETLCYVDGARFSGLRVRDDPACSLPSYHHPRGPATLQAADVDSTACGDNLPTLASWHPGPIARCEALSDAALGGFNGPVSCTLHAALREHPHQAPRARCVAETCRVTCSWISIGMWLPFAPCVLC